MKGLVLKDLYTVYSYRKQYALALLFMILWSVFMKNTGFISMYLLILGGMLVLSSMSVDEGAHFNRLALTMPVSRKNLVQSKYILLLITMGGGTIIVTALNAFFQSVFQNWEADMEWQAILLTAVLFIATYSVTLPIIFKLGVEKARYVYIGVMLGLALIVFGTASVLEKIGVDLNRFEEPDDILFILVLTGISVLILFISYLCSLKVVKKKEW